jgi:hypothetical protein
LRRGIFYLTSRVEICNENVSFWRGFKKLDAEKHQNNTQVTSDGMSTPPVTTTTGDITAGNAVSVTTAFNALNSSNHAIFSTATADITTATVSRVTTAGYRATTAVISDTAAAPS